MNNRNELQNEYRELVNKLNSTNRKANEKTVPVFSVHKNADIGESLIASVNSEKYLNIGRFQRPSRLIIDPNFEFSGLAKYIKKSLTDFDGTSDINVFIHVAILRLYKYDIR